MADEQTQVQGDDEVDSSDRKETSPLKLFKKLGLKEKDGSEKKLANEQNSVSAKPQPEDVKSLPQLFRVRFLGKRATTGLWGIKHTRKPVEDLIDATRKLKEGQNLPELQLHVSEKGIHATETPENKNRNFEQGLRPIDAISYGVQDVKYTRVVAIIVVDTTGAASRFECHAYVCTSRASARRLAFSLALAFKEFGRLCANKKMDKVPEQSFAIDLRSPEEIENDMAANQELDSEA